MERIIAPSMMCADIFALKETVKIFEKKGIKYLHIDIMDGHFVSNITLGTDYCKLLRKCTKIRLDIHLMIEDPELRLNWFEFGKGDMVSVHAESTRHLQKCLAAIKARGAKAIVAFNPATPLNLLDYVLEDTDGVLLMTVNPGFGGQKLVPQTLDKISDLRKYLDEHGRTDCFIEVDGNVSFDNIEKMMKRGADVFVAGTSSVFAVNGEGVEGNIDRMNDIFNNLG